MLIRAFEPRDQDAARRLILAGLGEHFGWIDETCNSDLDDIAANYLQPGHVFLVAQVDGGLVGTGALLNEGANGGRLVRISVLRTRRRQGVGRAIVMCLLDAARHCGLRRVRVATEPDWGDALRLYESCGLREYTRDDVDVWLALDL
jgi:putative acetyltransferase